MAEGIDGAADAFRTAISPTTAPRQRDDSGRFTSSSRPESMFEPRPVEGDPLTGDTRDGGEDARLAAAERRIADGRAEQGDEQSLQNAARSRNANRDARHANDNARAANDNEGSSRQELQTQDPERTDVDAAASSDRGDADGNAVSDAEGQGGEGPEERYEVTVDGKTMEVTLKEALKGYVREQTFYERMHKVAEARQAVEQEAQGVVVMRDAYVQRLEYLSRVLAQLTPPQPDWDQEFRFNPLAAHDKQKAYAQIFNTMQWAAGEMQREADARAQEYDRNAQSYAVDQFTHFVQEANIKDENALRSEMSRMRSYGKMRGFAEGELATVYDKRMLLVLRDAANYHQSVSEQPKPIAAGKGKTLVPGVGTPIGSATRRSLDEAMEKLARTGRTDDAAQVFQRLIR